MMKHLAITLTLLILGCANIAHAAQKLETKTIIHDQKEADLLLGKHLFTEIKISSGGCKASPWQHFGTSTIQNINGTYHISGKHEEYWKCEQPLASENGDITTTFFEDGGYITLDGIITSIEPHIFHFSGKIDYFDFRGTHAQKPDILCHSDGDFTFSRSEHEQYWRLQETNKLCSVEGWYGAGDIDLFTAPLNNQYPKGKTQRLYLNKNAHIPPEYFH